MKGMLLALALLTAVPAHAGIRVGFHSHGELAAYGRWVWVAEVGDVWVPSVPVTWQPYVNGHWAWSPWGWMWVSYDPWGYMTDHYGRWLWTPYHGWVWVPGRIWAPAWVVWISGPGWIGWSPAPPDWYDGYWRRPDYHRHHHRWVVVHERGFLSPSLADERLPEHRVKTEVVRTLTRREKPGFSPAAPVRETIERVTGKQAPVVRERPVITRTPDPTRSPYRYGKAAAPSGEPQRVRVPERDREPWRDPAREEVRGSPERGSPELRRPADRTHDGRTPSIRERNGAPERGSVAPSQGRRQDTRERSRVGQHERAGAAGRAPRALDRGAARR